MKRLRLLFCFVVVSGCASPDPKPDGQSSEDTGFVCVQAPCNNASDAGGADAAPLDASSSTGGLPDRCRDFEAWSPGEKAFTNATEASKLAAIGAEGVRISSVDFDGDGYADLAIRRVGAQRDDFAGGQRAVWLLRNAGDGTFEDVTEASGIVDARYTQDATRPAEVFAFADVDNDGDLDAFTGFSNDATIGEAAEIMFNDGNGNFEFGTPGHEFERKGEKTSIGGAAFVDANRDGRIDLWLGHGAVDQVPQQDALYLQGEDAIFRDVTAEVGLTTSAWNLGALNDGRAHSNAWSAAACDLDGDGTAELLAASYGRAPNSLFTGELSGDTLAFTNISVASGYAFDQRTDWSDNESARCFCMHNRDAEDCADVPEPEYIRCDSAADAFRWNHARDRELYRLGGNSGTTVCADVNNDGQLDLLTTEIVHWDVGSSSDPSELLFNVGEDEPKFERPGNEVTGLTKPRSSVTWDDGDITAAVFDFDNDGRPDVYIGSTDYPGARGHLYHQKADGSFEAVSLEDGIDHPRSHGIAVADYDRDGDLDVVVGHSTFRCSQGGDCLEGGHARLWENQAGQHANFIQLRLEGGEGTNRAAIGARVTVEAGGTVQTQEVGGGHGHYGMQHDLVLHFGLAEACEAKVTVRWPDAQLTEQVFTVPAGYRFVVEQGQEPRPVETP